VPIRLTSERWSHITEEHAELAGLRLEVLEVVTDPERILAGGAGELLAVRTQLDGKMLVAVYREVAPDDGFIITAFLTRRTAPLNRRGQLWP
jgi:hypothetical protein